MTTPFSLGCEGRTQNRTPLPKQKKLCKKSCVFYRAFFYFCALCLCFIVPKAQAQDISLLFSYGNRLENEATRTIMQSRAYTLALQRIHKELLRHKALAFGIKDESMQLALISILYTPIFTEKKLSGPHNSSMQVHLRPKTAAVEKEITTYLKQESLLQLRLEWLKLLQENTQKSGELYKELTSKKSQLHENQVEDLQKRIQPLAQRLEALWILNTALEFFQEQWLKPQEAEKILRKALQKDAKLAIIWACLGEVQLQQDKVRQALESVNNALNLESNRARALYIRGLGHLRLHQPSTAKVDFDAALTLQPNTSAWHMARGAAYLMLEEFVLMCDDFTQACATGQCEGLIMARKQGHCFPKTP